MKIDISETRLILIQEALETQIRLLESYINRDAALQAKIDRFKSLKMDIDTVMLQQ